MKPSSPPPSLDVEQLLALEGPVLLVEFTNADQFPGRVNGLFPLVGGYFRSRGMPVRWIRFGISTLNLMQNDRDEVTLTEEELERLLEMVTEHQPALISITDPLHLPQHDALCAASPGVEVLCTTNDLRTDLLYQARNQMRALPELRPFYGVEPGNVAAEQRRVDNIYLFTTDGCGHHHFVANNPRFAGLEPSLIEETLGCTFCTSVRSPTSGSEDAAGRLRNQREWTRRQVRAMAEDRKETGRLPNALLFERLPAKAVQEACLEELRQHGLDDEVQVLFAIRTNEIPAFESRMHTFFEAHPDSRLGFGVYASGIESFSARELQLYNKGTSPQENLHAIVSLRALSHRYPDQFWYTGLSFLLFTPWTSLSSLHLNVGLIALLGISRKESGNVFQSRLRLHATIPLKPLAEREGLLIDEVSDPVLVMNRRKLFAEEHPWRYAEPRLEPLTQIVLRFDLLGSESADEVADDIALALEAVVGTRKIVDDEVLIPFFLSLVEVTLEHPEVLELPVLLARTIERRRRQLESAAAGPAPDRFRIGHQRLTLPVLVERLRTLFGSDGPKVIALEGLRSTDPTETARQALLRAGLGTVHLDPDPEGDGEQTLLFARDARDLEAYRAGDLVTRASLRGIPACCAAALGAREESGGFPPPAPAPAPSNVAWQAWIVHLETTEAVPTALLPGRVPALAFPPCRPDCPEAARVQGAWFETLGAHLLDEGRTLHLLELTGDGGLSSLPPSGADASAGVHPYDPEAVLSSDPELLELLRRGDRLRLLPAQVQILSGDRLLGCLTGTHAPWMAERIPEPEAAEVWRELGRALALRESVGQAGEIYRSPFVVPDQIGDLVETEEELPPLFEEPEEEEKESEDSGEPEHLTHERALALLHRACSVTTEPVGDLAADDCWEEEDGLVLRLTAGGAFYSLLLLDRRSTKDHLIQTPHFKVAQTRSKDDPLRGAEHRRWVEAAVRTFDHLLTEQLPELLPEGPL